MKFEQAVELAAGEKVGNALRTAIQAVIGELEAKCATIHQNLEKAASEEVGKAFLKGTEVLVGEVEVQCATIQQDLEKAYNGGISSFNKTIQAGRKGIGDDCNTLQKDLIEVQKNMTEYKTMAEYKTMTAGIKQVSKP